MIDIKDKKYELARKKGYLEGVENEVYSEFEYTFVGQFIKKYPERIGLIDTLRDVCGHIPMWEDITDRNLKEFKERISEKMCSNSQKSSFLRICSVLNDNKNEVEIPSKRFSEILRAKSEPVQSIYLTSKEIERFRKVLVNTDKEKYIQAMFLISCYTGCRHSDAVELTIDNVSDGVISYVSKKTSKMSCVKTNKHLIELLGKYEKIDVSDTYFNKVVRKIAMCAGINETVKVFKHGESIVGEKWRFISSHTARRSFISNKLSEGYSILDVSRAAGHSGIGMTERYDCREIAAI